ncbi:MAG: FixH family protein [Hyphomicrobiaceae bacterium]|nr:FixH family protein [Hyphomicrobiaceae bacterium]
MTLPISFRAGLAALALSLIATGALAAAADYEFQPLKVDVKKGAGSELAVRLVHKATGKPVTGAVLFRTRLDMGPDSMAEMTARHVAMPSSEPGVYRFKADLTMAGGWALRIMGKVPGEKDTVQGVVVFQAKD